MIPDKVKRFMELRRISPETVAKSIGLSERLLRYTKKLNAIRTVDGYLGYKEGAVGLEDTDYYRTMLAYWWNPTSGMSNGQAHDMLASKLGISKHTLYQWRSQGWPDHLASLITRGNTPEKRNRIKRLLSIINSCNEKA